MENEKLKNAVADILNKSANNFNNLLQTVSDAQAHFHAKLSQAFSDLLKNNEEVKNQSASTEDSK